MFGGLDPEKLLFILLVGIIVVGPERLPRIARQIGTFFHDLSRMRERFESEVRDAIPGIDLPTIPVLPKRGITGYLTSLMTSATVQAEAGGAVSSDLLDGAVGYPSEESASLPAQPWVSTSSDGGAFAADVPAGWNSVGAPAPGYASGSLLAPVPSISASGPLAVDAELNFDEPGWN